MTLGWDDREADKRDIIARRAELFDLDKKVAVAKVSLSEASLFTLKTMVRVILGQELRAKKPDPEVFESVERLCYETGLNYKELFKQAALGRVN